MSVRSSSNGLLLPNGQGEEGGGGEVLERSLPEVGGKAGLEKPCKVRAWRNLVGNHHVQGVVNMFQLWNCLNKILDM